MARSRNIKPGFFQNEQLGELSPIERLAFIGMWTIADFKGCLEFRPKRLKVQLMPYDDCDFENIAINLDKSGLIRNYSVQGQRYIKIINFTRHQNPHKNEREAGSDVPDITDNETQVIDYNELTINTEQRRNKDGTNRADSLLLIPDSLLLIPDSLNLIPDISFTNVKDSELTVKKQKRKSDETPYEEILRLYGEMLPEMQQQYSWTDKRKAQVRALWEDKGELPELEDWEKYFKFIRSSKFLMGKVPPINGHKQFKGSLEWITKRTNYINITERKYHGE